ncbi:hypothetical protein [Paraburkholderia flagellata]|nr:hypothetical protein [Paraburkholderia flagellata]
MAPFHPIHARVMPATLTARIGAVSYTEKFLTHADGAEGAARGPLVRSI